VIIAGHGRLMAAQALGLGTADPAPIHKDVDHYRNKEGKRARKEAAHGKGGTTFCSSYLLASDQNAQNQADGRDCVLGKVTCVVFVPFGATLRDGQDARNAEVA
jgi:hypothetical protein